MTIKIDEIMDLKKIESLVESLPLGIIIFDKNFKIVFANQNSNSFFYSDNLEGKSVTEIFNQSDLQDDFDNLKKGYAFEKKFNVIKANKKILSYFIKSVPVANGNNFEGGIITIEDFNNILNQSSTGDSIVNIIKYLDNYILIDKDSKIESFKFDNSYEKFKDIKAGEKISSFFNPLENARITYSIEQVSFNKKINISDLISEDLKFCFRLLTIPISDKADKILLIFIDIKNELEEKKLLKTQINDFKKELTFWESLSIPFFICNSSGIITEWQKGAATLFNIKRSKVINKHLSKVIKEFNRKLLKLIIDEVDVSGIWNSEIEVKNDFVELFVDVTVQKIFIENSYDYVFYFRDITKRKEQEANLRASEEMFRNIVTNTSEFIITIDDEGIIHYLNPAFCEKLGKSSSELIDTGFKDLVDNTFFEEKELSIDYLIEFENRSVEIPIKSPDGTIFTFGNVTAIRSYNGTLKYLNLILTDITDKKKTERDLQLIKSMFEASMDGILVINKRKIILTNKYFLSLFGYGNEREIINKDPLDFIAHDDVTQVAEKIQLHEKGDRAISQFEFSGVKKDKKIISIEASITSYEFDSDNYIVLFLRDITETKKAQEKLRLSEERYRDITENINEFFWTYELVENKLKPVFFTHAIKNITGYEIEQFLTDEKFWLRIVHPADLKSVFKGIKRIINDHTKNSLEQEFRIFNKNGIIVWVENKITVVRENKKIVKLFGIVSDISKDKQIEEELKRNADELKQMNDTKDRFISVISHDLRTPFSSILGFTDVLLNDSSLTEEKKLEYIKYIQESSKNMLSLVNSLLDWTRLQTGRIKFEPHKLNVRILVDKSIQINSGKALVKKIELKNLISNDIYVHGDENLLLQVFNNLISNALKFTNEGGFIHVDSQELVNKKQILFSVIDSGVGIKDEDKEKLFRVDTKYTTRGTSGELGSGLGLSLCKEIVEKHGGSIWVDSELGKGTEFYFTIPVSSNSILLVDKKKTDRILYKKLLQSLLTDFEILEAEKFEEALNTIQSIQPALIISEHDLGTENALSLIKKLRTEDRGYNPPFIILSGEINKSIVEEYNEEGVDYIFKKPVKLNVFKNAIDNSLRKAIYK